MAVLSLRLTYLDLIKVDLVNKIFILAQGVIPMLTTEKSSENIQTDGESFTCKLTSFNNINHLLN